MPDDLVALELRGGVAVVTLNDPARRNILTAPLVQAIDAAMDRAERDEATRCIVLTGAGSAFCAGAELATLRGAADGAFDDIEVVYQGFLRVRDSPLPTIAAVNGPAVGAGFNLALACDVRLAAASARFDTRFAALRLHPGGGHAWMLARAVGQQRATLACLFGEVWDARAALDAGLVAAVIDGQAELVDAAVALGQRLAHQEKVYVQRLVATLRAALSTTAHANALAQETDAQRWSATRPAFRDGVQAIEDRIARGR
ncbi:MAG TPA: enoyl-CoA hydratase-related protein [Streptosporangiaceae bacterium]|nr:enoyl-CoA hydratase-related protein [Streptosporangiaceae bacterium]